MYAFYDSMGINMSLQFDLLPVSIRKNNQKQDYADQNFDTNEASDGIAESVLLKVLLKLCPKSLEMLKISYSSQAGVMLNLLLSVSQKKLNILLSFFSLEVALFYKHFANNAFDLHMDFDEHLQ